jgi:hypothetical protein
LAGFVDFSGSVSAAPADAKFRLGGQGGSIHEQTGGDRAPIFAVPTSQGTLADYDRDYYGKHHLVLTFVPAAFTPV